MRVSGSDLFWKFEIDYWFKQLNSSAHGLSSHVATTKLQENPHLKKVENSIKRELFLVLEQFRSPLMLLLIGAIIISAFLGDTSDVIIILVIVLSSGLLSYFQERNANRIVAKLQAMIGLKCTVYRDGIAQEIDTHHIVSGDIIEFNAGDMIPADCLLIASNELYVNEASLTGESFPLRKEVGVLDENTALAKRTNSLWEGTNIISGSARALVINTGDETIFGSIVQSASQHVESSFEKGIREFGLFLTRITVGLAAIIWIANLMFHKNIVESALFALALAVGMAPELLPAITTIAMSSGAKRMLAKKVIVKKLSSIQNLGEVNLLCTDKTGTITEGIIHINRIIDISGNENEFIRTLAFWNATFETGYTNPIDEALKKMPNTAFEKPQKLGEIPYDFIRKRLSIAIQTSSARMLISKGAFNEIRLICSSVYMANGSIEPIEKYRKTIDEQFEHYGEQGFRTIAICYKTIGAIGISKEDESEMIFAGFILLADPVKTGIVETLSELKKLNIILKIITGDNKNVAQSIGQQIGIKDPVIMTGKELLKVGPEALEMRVKSIHIFSEVEPQHKELIIRALRKSYTVAYLGDGINDVSAISAADIGISVDNSADVLKDAADIVLLEKDLSVLLDGLKEGRKTFANTLKYVYISTGCTFGNMFSVAIASLFLPFLPMLPKQILLTNFISDFPYLSIAADSVDPEQLEKPGKWDIKRIRRYMIIFGIHSSVFDVITFMTLFYFLKVKEAEFQTGWFVESILTEIFILFIIRTHKKFFKSIPGLYLFLLSVFGFILTIVLPYLPFGVETGLVPLTWQQLGSMLLIVLVYSITADFLKVWFFKRHA